MNRRTYSPEQIKALLENPYVARCTATTITWSQAFKMMALERYQKEGASPRQIFKEAGLDLHIIGAKTANDRIRDWRNAFERKGEEGLSRRRGKRGRPFDPKNLTGPEKLKYLEAEVAYLKAENAFLAKLRKKRLN